VFALVDCNNFYASCERVFNPKMNNRPVVVLSNNDGCVIARSQEAKDLGIKMGAPAFMMEKELERNNVAVFSSNYALYGDISNRVIKVLTDFSPNVEMYSIDECFLDLANFNYTNLEEYANKIRQTVYQYTGIPVSVGIAKTKTLAKLANRYAKKHKRDIGVHILDTPETVEAALKSTDIGDVWGIGGQYAKYLNRLNINTAFDLTQISEAFIKEKMSIVGLRLVKELKGMPCIPLELVRPAKKGICTSRSFGKLLTDYEDIATALCNYVARCAEKLRKQKSCANILHVFVETNPFREQDRQYTRTKVITLPVATNDTTVLIKYALMALKAIYRQGYNYKKTGIVVMGIVPQSEVQSALFDSTDYPKHSHVMAAMDKINKLMGKDKVRIAAQGFDRKWKLRQEKLSPCYTTRWNELLTVSV
jgi:DNA polymerase V